MVVVIIIIIIIIIIMQIKWVEISRNKIIIVIPNFEIWICRNDLI